MSPPSLEIDPVTDASCVISFSRDEAGELRVFPRHIGRHEVSFEIAATDPIPRTSEVLKGFQITFGGRAAYTGRATTLSVTPSGSQWLCHVALEEPWSGGVAEGFDRASLPEAFDGFLDQWRRHYQVRPEFKVVVADMQNLLSDLELWLTRVELGLSSGPPDGLELQRRQWAKEFSPRTTAALNALFDKFERAATEGPPETHPACRVFARRQLHPLLLCAPFLHRTYRKPLGYAGDYEMVNMISRDPYEGGSLYAKLINHWFLQQPPAEAHRNRLKYLRRRISETALRVSREQRPARVLSVGCGPAVEVRDFVNDPVYAGMVDFTLLDFNQETLVRTKASIDAALGEQRRVTKVEYVKKSVMSILKDGNRPLRDSADATFDFVYCAGLFDYLTDLVCRRLSSQLYNWLKPGGLFLSTNVHSSNPWPRVMDFIMDWHLIYRDTPQMLATCPEQVAAGDCTLTADSTGVNIFLETWKPPHA